MDSRTRRMTRNFVRLGSPVAAVLLAVALPGCSAPTPEELTLACPRVSIVKELSTVTQFRPGGQTANDVVARGELADYRGNCEYGEDGVTVNVSLLLGAEKGPAFTGNEAKFRYFVAVLRPGEKEPAAKSEFDTEVVFPEGKTRAADQEDLAPRIPLPKDVNAKDWKVVIGFQLSNEQRDYNLAQEKARETHQ